MNHSDEHNDLKGWKGRPLRPSFEEAHSSVRIVHGRGFWRKLASFAGPGLIIAVGYMDPGNWATDIAGGAKFGYLLLSIVFISNLMAILLQHLSLKLGIVTGRDLAQACRDHYSPPVNFVLWVLCEIAIAACDLAEVLGSAVALNLLFNIPLTAGVIITSFDIFLILYFQKKGFRFIEAVIGTLILIIGGCFIYEIIVSNPHLPSVLKGFIPQKEVFLDREALYISIGILGATVMPHNLYLHSSIAQTRDYKRDTAGKKEAVYFSTLDSTISLTIAFFINAAILVTAAAAFHGTAHQDVADINDAYKLLTPVLAAPLASVLFAVALLASGQNSTLTGTLAGQIVMEGFLEIKFKPWIRRAITRLIAIVPAVIITILYGHTGVGQLLVFSQVVLSLQLAFAVVPLVQFTSERKKMGQFTNGGWLALASWLVAAIIIIFNSVLLYQTFFT